MLDMKFLRENVDSVKENMKKKFQEHKLELVDKVVEMDKVNRQLKQRGDDLRAKRNAMSKEIGGLMAKGLKDEANAVKAKVQAMADEVEERLYKAGYEQKQIEGYQTANWILMDYQDIIVHIFDEENRLFYDLERIWRDGKVVSEEELEA